MNNFFKHIVSKSFLRFLVSGSCSTFLDFILYMLISLKLNVSISKFISMCCASLLSFIMNKKWAFNDKSSVSVLQITSYIVVQIINVGTNVGMNTFVYNITNMKVIAFIIATGIAMIVNYLLQKYFIFKEEHL